MMQCPQCGVKTLVLDSRPFGKVAVRRRRECWNGHRFTTLEEVRQDTLTKRLATLEREVFKQGAGL